MRIIGLIQFKDAERYLQDCLDQFIGHLDGVIGYDAGSFDKGFDIFTGHILFTVCLCSRPTKDWTFETENRAKLLRHALDFGATHVLCFDADERFERQFLKNLHALIEQYPDNAFCLNYRELWDAPDQYRVDGIFGTKQRPVLFPCRPFSNYHPKEALHTLWIPPEQYKPGLVKFLHYNIYHLGTLTRADREARVAKHNLRDPSKKYQSFGYDYMLDETGLQLETIPAGRGYA